MTADETAHVVRLAARGGYWKGVGTREEAMHRLEDLLCGQGDLSKIVVDITLPPFVHLIIPHPVKGLYRICIAVLDL